MSEQENKPRLCHLVKWPDNIFQGYGFNLHAEKGKAGQYIGKVDEGSPSEAAGLKDGDRIVEVNGVNIGNENHQQVVTRIKAGGDEVKLLVVDQETDRIYKENKQVVKSDLPEVVYLTSKRPRPDEQDNTDEPEASPRVSVNGDDDRKSEKSERSEKSDHSEPREPEDEPEIVAAPVQNEEDREEEEVELASEHLPRNCRITKWPDFQGYGFNLHAERDRVGQFIGKIDDDSPAEAAGLKEGDRIIEVNGANIENETHQQVIQRIKAGGETTTLMVLDREADDFYKAKGMTISSQMSIVRQLANPTRGGAVSNGVPPPAEDQPQEELSSQFYPRLCHIKKWPDFQGYGFNLHAEKDRKGQFIGQIDADSPAEAGGLKDGDRIIEVNGSNIEDDTHQQVIQKIKAGGDETRMLVLDRPADDYFKSKGIRVNSSMENVRTITTPARSPQVNGTSSKVTNSAPVSSYQPATKPVEPSRQPASNGDVDFTKLSAKEMRELVASKKKKDPRKENTDFRRKYDEFNRL